MDVYFNGVWRWEGGGAAEQPPVNIIIIIIISLDGCYTMGTSVSVRELMCQWFPWGGWYIWHFWKSLTRFTDKRERGEAQPRKERWLNDPSSAWEWTLPPPKNIQYGDTGETGDATGPTDVMLFVWFAPVSVGKWEKEGEQAGAETDIKCFTVWCPELLIIRQNRTAARLYYFTDLLTKA